MPIEISKEMKTLVNHFQEHWRPLQETGDLLAEKTLSTFTEDLGLKHRKDSPDLYTQNALKILDFYALQVPVIVESIIEKNKDNNVLTTMNAITDRSEKHFRSAAFYLDNKHCVPHLLQPKDPQSDASVKNSEKLFQKICLLVWFMKEFYNFDKKTTRTPETTVLITYFIDSKYDKNILKQLGFFARNGLEVVLKLIPERKRLSTLETRINAYEKLNGISRPAIAPLNLLRPLEDEKTLELKAC